MTRPDRSGLTPLPGDQSGLRNVGVVIRPDGRLIPGYVLTENRFNVEPA